jgi:hypothetical protein
MMGMSQRNTHLRNPNGETNETDEINEIGGNYGL